MGEQADYLTEQGLLEIASHETGQCESHCSICLEEEAALDKRDKKYRKIQKLMKKGVLQELCPVPDNRGGTKHWQYHALRPEDLPPDLKSEFEKHGVIIF